MGRFGELWRRLRFLARRRQFDADLEDEMRLHIDLRAQEQMQAGAAAEEARYIAQRRFGNAWLLRETSHEIWGWNSLEMLIQDLRYAVRMLFCSPAFTITAVLSLALGIGANTAIFTLLHALLWRPLPVKAPQEIFHLMRASSAGDFAGEFSISYPLFQQFAKIARPWAEIFATSSFGSTKFGLDALSSERVAGQAVSANFFSTLHVEPILGRVFEP